MLVLALLGALGATEHRAPASYAPESGGDAVASGPPPGLIVALEAPAAVVMGEGWVVHYVVRATAAPFTLSDGGDGRAVRPVRTWLEAVHESGVFADDPHPAGFVCLGGRIVRPRLEPGADHVITILPRSYVRLDRPGRWTLRVFHDLGFGPERGDGDPRWTAAEVLVVEPDAATARRVFAEHRSRLGRDGWLRGQRGSPPADFAALEHPLYLPLLVELARGGSYHAIIGLGVCRDPRAPAALAALLDIDHLPVPEDEAAVLSRASSTPSGVRALILRTLARRPGSTPDVALAQRIDARLVPLGADADVTVRAAARALAVALPARRETLHALLDAAGDDPAEHALVDELIGAITADAAIPPPEGEGVAAQLLWLRRLAQPEFRPLDWQDRLFRLLIAPQPRVREMAVRAVPAADLDRWRPLLEALRTDRDSAVRWYAAERSAAKQ